MLGNEGLSVRLGGIFGLCQLARDHPQEFHLQVVNLLATFVRHPTTDYGADTVDGLVPGSVPRRDIQEIIDFFGKRSTEGREIEKAEHYAINLKGANLNAIEFPPGSNLEGIELQRTNLTGASFFEVQGLTLTQLWGADADHRGPANFENTYDSETGKSLDGLVLNGGKPRLLSASSPSASPPPSD